MLTKFETKSTRVKGLAFHPNKKWILASLHNGIIQLWDYEEKTLLNIFDEHKGPVRGLDFHPHQPIFVSGGDDAKIKVWDLKRTKKCIFSIDAHEDYIRTTFFHREHPWIVSASDDQSIRIWNWQSRNRVVVLTGHTHYVMCAQFHPKEDLILSTSIDQTLRLWDISSLTSKSKAKDDTGLPEILSRTDYTVESKDAHSSEINWCSFHPNPDRKLCLSAADDNFIKVWKYDRYGLSEQYILRGHYKNVNCAVFHPTKDLLLSASEDGSVKIWDLERRVSLVDSSIKKESERFWTIAGHPNEDLFAAGHDTGLVVFKTVRQRPAYCVTKDFILHTKDNQVYEYDMKNWKHEKQRQPIVLLKAKKGTDYYYKIDCIIDSSNKRQLLVTTRSSPRLSQSSFRLYNLRGQLETEPSVSREGITATFISQTRFAAVEWPSTVKFCSLNGEERKRKWSLFAKDIIDAGPGKLLCKYKDANDKICITLHDIESNTDIHKLHFDAKRIVISEDKKFIACLNSNRMILCDGQLNKKAEIVEQRKIKSACWDNQGALLYTTPVQVKYALTDGHTSTLCTTPETLYLVAVRDDILFCLDRKSVVRPMQFFSKELRFKQAVVRNDRDEIQRICSKHKMSRAEISYLVQKGFPGLALKYVDDVHTRFPLALKAFAIDAALESAEVINSKLAWEQLAETAMKIGHVKAAERAYKELKETWKLAFLYYVNGQRTKMFEARDMARKIGNISNEFLISCLLKDYTYLVDIYRRSGRANLAYCCAVNHGLVDLAKELVHEVEQAHLDDGRLPPLEKVFAYEPPVPKKNAYTLDERPFENWPLLRNQEESFEVASADESEAEVNPEEKGDWDEDDDEDGSVSKKSEASGLDEFEEPVDAQEDGWVDEEMSDLGDDEVSADPIPAKAPKKEDKKFTPPKEGKSLIAEWSRVSDLAVHHVLAGSYKSAIELLKTQVGIVNTEPLVDIIKDLFLQSRVAYQGIALYPTLYTYPTSADHQVDVPLPAGGYKLEDLEKLMSDCYSLFTKGRFEAAIESFRSVILRMLFLQTDDADKAKSMIDISKEYILGINVWLERKKFTGKEESQYRRVCELAVYFSKLNLVKHKHIVLEQALKVFIKRKEFQKTQAAASVARRFLRHPSSGDKKNLLDEANKIKSLYDVQADQALKMDYDDQEPYSLCAASFKPIRKNNSITECPLCDAKYLPEYRGKVCQICNVAEIGKSGTGIRYKSNYSESTDSE